MGVSNFDLADLPGTLDPDNFATLSVVPGVYATLEMSPRWSLLGIANLGLGARLDGEDTALIHRFGLRSRYTLGDGGSRWHLIAGLERYGFNTRRDRSGHLLPLSLAVEYEFDVEAWSSEAGPTTLVTHLAATQYLDDLSFGAIEEVGSTIQNDVEIGLAVRPAEGFRLWKLRWERIGIGYRRGDGDDAAGDSDFEGIRLFFQSLFDQ